MLVDSHAHIYLDAFANDFDGVLERARMAGVEIIVMPAIDIPSIIQAIELAEKYEGLFAMAALHPSEIKDATEADFERIVALCGDPHVVAVGETGLDYYWDRSFDAKQQDFLRRHIRLAVASDLPVVFHNRESTEDLIRIVEEERAGCDDPARMRGIFHCFTGDAAAAKRVHDLGFYIGVGGIVTFKNAGLDKSVLDIPLDWMVVETDAPYLAPSPHRGTRNEPANTRLIAEKVAEIKGTTLEAVAAATTRNARAVFSI